MKISVLSSFIVVLLASVVSMAAVADEASSPELTDFEYFVEMLPDAPAVLGYEHFESAKHAVQNGSLEYVFDGGVLFTHTNQDSLSHTNQPPADLVFISLKYGEVHQLKPIEAHPEFLEVKGHLYFQSIQDADTLIRARMLGNGALVWTVVNNGARESFIFEPNSGTYIAAGKCDCRKGGGQGTQYGCTQSQCDRMDACGEQSNPQYTCYSNIPSLEAHIEEFISLGG